MKKIYLIMMTATLVVGHQSLQAQCTNLGPNLLGAKGTFSTPFITNNTAAANCLQSGASTFSPLQNVGNALTGCTTTTGNAIPCSDYTYTAASNGLGPEGRYSILKSIGDASGGNCIKSDWRGSDHTGDGGYFMAVNGAPSTSVSPIFYQIKRIPVCQGTTYEFSAYVINLLPSTSNAAQPGTQPNISFRVNGTVIANSGPIAYTATPTWIKVGGTFTATTDSVDLQVVNATQVASGNDLGIDDISFNVCQSSISVNGPATGVCADLPVSLSFTVNDPTQTKTWYKWQISTNGGSTYTDLTTPQQATFVGTSYTLTYDLGVVNALMNGNKYRLVVASSASGLSNADCGFNNEFNLIVIDCGPLPVKFASFTGKYQSPVALLEWQTSQEINSHHFDLYRSFDGIDFTLVSTVQSAGFSNVLKSYSYSDNVNRPGSNVVYYRLKQVDINGKSTFSTTVRLNLATSSSSIKVDVYPNPFSADFTVALNASKTGSAVLTLRNNAGQLIATRNLKLIKGNNSILINNLPELSTGVYVLSINNDEINQNIRLQKF